MKRVLYDLNSVQHMIKQNEKLLLAGDEQVLRELPKGNWIGGTIPYFMAENGGTFSQNHIFVTKLPNKACFSR